MSRWGIVIFLFVLHYSYSNLTKQENLKEVLYWNNRTISFDVNLKLKVVGQDTVLPDFPNKSYKLLVYVGPRGCTSCQLNLYAWNHLIDTLLKEYQDLDIVFVVNVPYYKEFEALEKQNKFTHPVFYDIKGEFAKNNNFPKNKTVQILFLGKDNKVLLAGDPIKHNKMLACYKEIIQGKK